MLVWLDETFTKDGGSGHQHIGGTVAYKMIFIQWMSLLLRKPALSLKMPRRLSKSTENCGQRTTLGWVFSPKDSDYTGRDVLQRVFWQRIFQDDRRMIWAVNSDFGTVVDDGSNRIETLARQSDQLENSSGHIEIVGTRYLDVKEAIFPSRNMRIPLNHFKRIEWPGFANKPGGKEIVVRCRQGIAN